MRAVLVLSAAFAALSLGAAVPFEGNTLDTLDCFSLEAKSRSEGRRDFLSDWQAAHIELELTAWRGKNLMWMYHKFQATVDTGTSLLFLPDPLASRYWEDVPGVQKSDLLSGVYKFPCEGSQDLPDLLFKLPTEHVIRIPGPYLNYGPLDTEPSLCWAGMQSAKDMAGTVLGDVMLKAVFVAFDVGKNRIGLANKILHDV